MSEGPAYGRVLAKDPSFGNRPPVPHHHKEMELLTRASFKGTKSHHKRLLNLELRHDNGIWHVVICSPGGAYEQSGIQMYEGMSQDDAEQIFMTGFVNYITDEYVLNCEDDRTREMAFSALTRMNQDLYMKILTGLGYRIEGQWEIRAFFTGAIEGEIDRIGMVMTKQKPRRRIWD